MILWELVSLPLGFLLIGAYLFLIRLLWPVIEAVLYALGRLAYSLGL